MTFDSIEFMLLLALVVPAVWLLPGKGRAGLLLLASMVFYAAWSVPMTGLILISGMTDYAIGLGLERFDGGEGEERAGVRKLLLVISLIVNLGILGYFKYQGFFLDNLAAAGLVEPGSWVEVVLPPGISFYTFQTMSYSIDVYRRELKAERSPLRFLLYVSFFPQLIAGPIERAGRLLPQIAALERRRATAEDLAVGTRLIVFGLFKKVVIADYLALAVDPVFADPQGASGGAALAALYCFTLQIYFDFSAYSEIAKGAARLVGVELVWNFDQPYLAANASDFWRRWHISLSEWFRDYVYKPLGGSRAGKSRVLFNLGATMFLSGLWHGAAWNFVLWGLFHGALLLGYHQSRDRRPVVALRERYPRLMAALAWALTLHLVILGWLLFRIEAAADAGTLLRAMARIPAEGMARVEVALVCFFYAVLAASFLAREGKAMERLHQSTGLSIVVYAAMAVAALLLARDVAPQFIYFQF